jgi:3-oxoadipate CoA-transferase beta subunit
VTGWTMDEVAARAGMDIPEGAFVNLGIGLPERVADHIPADREVILHSENGILGMGPRPPVELEDFELINAGKKPVTLLKGGAFFHHADSFAMIRGGHIDICLLGAFEVSMNGDIANWSTGDDAAPAIGGAMDLTSGVRSVRVISAHVTREGKSKLVERLTLPPTALAVVERIYTNLGIFLPRGGGFKVEILAPGINLDQARARTSAPLE